MFIICALSKRIKIHQQKSQLRLFLDCRLSVLKYGHDFMMKKKNRSSKLHHTEVPEIRFL